METERLAKLEMQCEGCMKLQEERYDGIKQRMKRVEYLVTATFIGVLTTLFTVLKDVIFK